MNPYKTSKILTKRYKVNPHATIACTKPTIGRVLNNVFWDKNAHNPSLQFLMISFQSNGRVPEVIALNILLKEKNAVEIHIIDRRIKAIFSIEDNNKKTPYFLINNLW